MTSPASAPLPAPEAPILFLDSGMGGLSVLGPALAQTPGMPVVYVADLAGLPYGEKSEIVVATRVCALLGRLTERYAPRLIVIACNTASTIALAHVRAVLEVPVVGTVPAIKPAALASRSGVIGVLGTEATLRQPYVAELTHAFASDKIVLTSAAPELVGEAEARLRGEPVDLEVVRAAMQRLVDQHGGTKIDQIVLGCTHFPLLLPELRAAAIDCGVQANVGFVDGSAGIARRIAHLTAGQAWPEDPVRIALFTGPAENWPPYAKALAGYGIHQLASV